MEPIDALAVGGGVLAIAMGALVLAQGAGRFTNRTLAALLFFEGVAHIGGPDLDVSLPTAAGLDTVHTLSVIAATGCYLLFLGTLSSPLAAPFRSRASRWMVLGATAVALALAFPQLPIPPDQDRSWRGLAYMSFALVAVYGLFVALSVVRRAPAGSAERQRAVAYAWAFGARDVSYFAGLVVPWQVLGVPEMLDVFTELAPVLFVPILAYGILRTQLFDIDLRIKAGVRRGTLVGVFAVVFVVAAQVAQEFLSEAYGWLVGGAAAATMLLALSPLQRIADRVANAAMPGVSASSEYLSYRKLQVYRATFEELSQDGELTPKERATLDRLRRELGIREDDARAIEQDAAVPG